MAKKKNYLNNRDIMKEIHRSKLSYCYFIDDEYTDYDNITDSYSKITPEFIEETKQAVAKEANRQLKEQGIKGDWTSEDVSVQDLVIRVMDHEHIPWGDESRQRKAKTEVSKRVRLKFPPFKQFKVNVETETQVLHKDFSVENNQPADFIIVELEDGSWVKSTEYYMQDDVIYLENIEHDFSSFVGKELRIHFCTLQEVGRSHWQGGLHNGYFSQEHGEITNNLAEMYMLLVDRYSRRGNWRNYSYLDEMKNESLLLLVQRGLQFNEFKGSNPFSYLSQILQNSFRGVLNTEKKNQDIRDEILESNNFTPSYTRQNENQSEYN